MSGLRVRRPTLLKLSLTTLDEPGGIVGSLPKAHIQAVVRSRIAAVRSCYEEGLAAWPGLEGRADVKFKIAPDGSVESAGLAASSLHNRPTECCIVEAAKRWRFDSPEGGGIVVVTYPFVLRD